MGDMGAAGVPYLLTQTRLSDQLREDLLVVCLAKVNRTSVAHLNAGERTEEDQDILPLFLPALLAFRR